MCKKYGKHIVLDKVSFTIERVKQLPLSGSPVRERVFVYDI